MRRLGTEPDLLLLHWPSSEVPLEETVGALNEARSRGHTRQREARVMEPTPRND